MGGQGDHQVNDYTEFQPFPATPGAVADYLESFKRFVTLEPTRIALDAAIVALRQEPSGETKQEAA